MSSNPSHHQIQRDLETIAQQQQQPQSSSTQSSPSQNPLVLVQYTETNRSVTITLNNPSKLNTFTNRLYQTLIHLLQYCDTCDRITFVILTGAGKFFTAGNDLGNVSSLLRPNATHEQIERELNTLIFDRVRALVDVLIDFTKILILAVNGPSVGIGVTMIPLCDFVFCSDRATFHTPFMKLGICAEACSSYTFPRLMGQLKANDILLQNVKLSAQEAVGKYGLVTRVIPHEQLLSQVQEFVTKQLAVHPCGALIATKQLMREKQVLHQVNERECRMLKERMGSKESRQIIHQFFKMSKM